MLDVTFIVFVDGYGSQQEAQIINTLRDQGFEPLVDGKHKTQKAWFVNNCKDPHLLFLPSGESYEYVDGQTPFAPIMGAFINNGDSSHQTLVLLDRWVKSKLFDKRCGDDDSDLEEFDHSISRPQTLCSACNDNDYDAMVEEEEQPYDFTYEYLELEDTMLYQVNKPFTDKPYTTVTRNYKQRGHLPFFSSLFKCQSWGVADRDILFLNKIWVFLNMPGECDIKKLVEERIESCTPGRGGRIPEAEPEVWRNTLENVKQILDNRKRGFITFDE